MRWPYSDSHAYLLRAWRQLGGIYWYTPPRTNIGRPAGYTSRGVAHEPSAGSIHPTRLQENAPSVDRRSHRERGRHYLFKLEDDAIGTNGLMGSIPPCCIAIIWKNASAGRVRLDMESAMQAPIVELETTAMPDRGHPLLIRGCVPSGQPTNQEVPVSSKASLVVLRARRATPRECTPMNMPEDPPLTQPETSRRVPLSSTPR